MAPIPFRGAWLTPDDGANWLAEFNGFVSGREVRGCVELDPPIPVVEGGTKGVCLKPGPVAGEYWGTVVNCGVIEVQR